jgi:hypothetical protein
VLGLDNALACRKGYQQGPAQSAAQQASTLMPIYSTFVFV